MEKPPHFLGILFDYFHQMKKLQEKDFLSYRKVWNNVTSKKGQKMDRV